jgi:predicted transposase/invertase (TIGR01784 family)
LFYASKSYSAQIERGEDYMKLNPTFFIGILDFKVVKNKNYINRHKIIDVETGENYIKDIEFTFIELPKFNKQESELETIIDQWVYFIKNAENLEVIPENTEDEGLKHAYEDAAKHNWTKLELESYDKVGMRQAMDKSRFEIALRKGLAAGIEKEVFKEKEKIALKLITRNLSNQEIAEDTGLTIEQIETLRN